MMGSSAANWSRAPAASPAAPVQRARFVAGGQGARVLGTVGVILRVGVGDQLEQVPGRRVAAAIAEIGRDSPHAAAGQVKDARACGSSTATHRPVRWQPRVGGQRGLDQGRGSLLPLASHVRRYLVEGDGLDQAVHQHQPSPAGVTSE